MGREEGLTYCPAPAKKLAMEHNTTTITSSPMPPVRSHTVGTVYQLRNGRDKKHPMLRSHFQAPVAALDSNWSAAARINVSSTKILLARSGKAKLQVWQTASAISVSVTEVVLRA